MPDTECLSYIISHKPYPGKEGLLVQGTGRVSNLPETSYQQEAQPGSKLVVSWPFHF